MSCPTIETMPDARSKHAIATGNFDMECRIQWADTSIHWISAKGRAYRNATGDPVRMMGTVMDITERKRIEEELKAANASLDAIIENIPLMLFIKDSSRCGSCGSIAPVKTCSAGRGKRLSAKATTIFGHRNRPNSSSKKIARR